MGMYCHNYVVPKGARDRIVHRSTTYRTSFITFMLGEDEHGECDYDHFPRIPRPSFCDEFDSDLVWVLPATEWIALAAAYRLQHLVDFPEEGPMYIDACTTWLASLHDCSDLEVIVAAET